MQKSFMLEGVIREQVILVAIDTISHAFLPGAHTLNSRWITRGGRRRLSYRILFHASFSLTPLHNTTHGSVQKNSAQTSALTH